MDETTTCTNCHEETPVVSRFSSGSIKYDKSSQDRNGNVPIRIDDPENLYFIHDNEEEELGKGVVALVFNGGNLQRIVDALNLQELAERQTANR